MRYSKKITQQRYTMRMILFLEKSKRKPHQSTKVRMIPKSCLLHLIDGTTNKDLLLKNGRITINIHDTPYSNVHICIILCRNISNPSSLYHNFCLRGFQLLGLILSSGIYINILIRCFSFKG